MAPKSVLLIIFLVMAGLPALPDGASGCNVCHSKNPKMVRMHQALGFKDCFQCHQFSQRKTPDEQKVQQKTDGRCIPCHAKK